MSTTEWPVSSTSLHFPHAIGHCLWKSPGKVTNLSAAIWNNAMYVGSAAGVVYALDTSTGHTIWQAPVGGQVDSVLIGR